MVCENATTGELESVSSLILKGNFPTIHFTMD